MIPNPTTQTFEERSANNVTLSTNPITIEERSYRKNLLLNVLADKLKLSSITEFQKEHNLTVDGIFGMKSYDALYKAILNVKYIDFEGHYFKTQFPKNQIVLHHSAGWDNARGMFDWWRNDGRTHVATAIGIEDNGTITQGYDEQFWAAHLGVTNTIFHQNNVSTTLNGVNRNVVLDRMSVAVEVCNWGALEQRSNEFRSWANAVVPKDKVVELNYKGVKFYEVYTEAEVDALKWWILLNAIRFNIPVEYYEDDMWKLSRKALVGNAGIFTHNSYRSDKSDVSPQPHLITMLQSLVNYTK